MKATFWTFSQIMQEAEIDGLMRRSPCVGVTLPKERAAEEMHFLDVDQVAALADAIDERYQTEIYTAAYTGLRAGELWALKVDRVNMLRRSLTVEESLSEVRGELRTGRTKTDRKRPVSLPRFLVEMLAEHMGHYSDDYVFTSKDGGPVRHRNFMRRHFTPALVRAGLPETVRFHDLRHTCAAILIGQGWNQKHIYTSASATPRSEQHSTATATCSKDTTRSCSTS